MVEGNRWLQWGYSCGYSLDAIASPRSPASSPNPDPIPHLTLTNLLSRASLTLPRYKVPRHYHGITANSVVKLYVHPAGRQPRMSLHTDALQRWSRRRVRWCSRVLRPLVLRRGAACARRHHAQGADSGQLLREGGRARGQPVLDGWEEEKEAVYHMVGAGWNALYTRPRGDGGIDFLLRLGWCG